MEEPEWTTHTSRRTGRTFYRNTRTGTTTYVDPHDAPARHRPAARADRSSRGTIETSELQAAHGQSGPGVRGVRPRSQIMDLVELGQDDARDRSATAPVAHVAVGGGAGGGGGGGGAAPASSSQVWFMTQHLNDTAARRRQHRMQAMMPQQDAELERRHANSRAVWLEQDAEMAAMEERARSDMLRMLGGGPVRQSYFEAHGSGRGKGDRRRRRKVNMGKEYSSDSEGDGPSERDDRERDDRSYCSGILPAGYLLNHHASLEAAEHAACAAVDAAIATGKRRCVQHHKFRRHASELATSVDGKLAVVKSVSWNAKRIRRSAIQANCLPAAGTFAAPAVDEVDFVLLEVDPRAAALEKILRRWYPPALHPGRNLRPISETDGHGGVSV